MSLSDKNCAFLKKTERVGPHIKTDPAGPVLILPICFEMLCFDQLQSP